VLTVLSFLPMEVLPLVLIIAAVGVIVGVVRPQAVGGILLLLIFLPIAGAFLDAVISQLPPWLVLLLVLGAILSVGRLLLTLLIGRRAADGAIGHVVGEAIVGIFRAAIWVLLWPVRGLRR
jgi:hypothetical protein